MSLLEKVEAALDTIRPYLLTDGGNVSVEEITGDNVVKLKIAWFLRFVPDEYHDFESRY